MHALRDEEREPDSKVGWKNEAELDGNTLAESVGWTWIRLPLRAFMQL
jgi:hypothetical protein